MIDESKLEAKKEEIVENINYKVKNLNNDNPDDIPADLKKA